MARTTPPYRCSECGWTTAKWVGRCGECQQWGTVVEHVAPTGILKRVPPINLEAERMARSITDYQSLDAEHLATGVNEFDRVLGGGVVPGAAILLSGEPGVGKSTLLLEVAARVARQGARVLYISAEESVAQVRLRAKRTNALEPNLFLGAETDLGTILGQVNALNPKLLIVDSVQTVTSANVDGIAGQPAQVREAAASLTRLAKDRGLPLLLVGHVTKDGSVAGPRMLEHLVDVVCHFEGDRQTSLRFIRALKNRFGPTDEVGCFEMTGDGIEEVADPSGLFLSRGDAVSGTCVTVALEGRRAIPVEVQALVSKASGPQPRRVVNGVDPSRVAMILAILERRAKLDDITAHDVYVSTVGGVRLTEPAADLAIATAIVSSKDDIALPHNFAAIGELSLAGEVRPVSSARLRLAEATRLGYTSIVDSEYATISAALAHARNRALTPRERELDASF